MQLRNNKSLALVLCILITVFAMIIEFSVSAVTGSLMLYSDGIHMLSHALALFIALLAIKIAQRNPNSKAEYISALINGIGLLFFSGLILRDAWIIFSNPEEIIIPETMITAVAGLIVNLVTARILFLSGVEDINTKGAFLHMLADTFSSVSIIIGALIIHYTNYFIIDAILSMVIAVVIGKWALSLIQSAYHRLKTTNVKNKGLIKRVELSINK